MEFDPTDLFWIAAATGQIEDEPGTLELQGEPVVERFHQSPGVSPDRTINHPISFGPLEVKP